MKLVRFGEPGAEAPGLVDAQKNIRDLSGPMAGITDNILSARVLAQLATIDIESLPIVKPSRLGACVQNVPKFICVGLNYEDHVRESGAEIPKEPLLFMKATSAICGPNDPVLIPKGADKVDWEVELGVVIGTEARSVSQASAFEYVAGYCVVNDVSERAWQLERTGQWVKGKSADSFGPIGPWLVTKDEVPDPQNLNLWLSVNGKRWQDSSTNQMIFPVDELVSYISHFMTLMPGDIISTGTPPGVGLGAKPPTYLKSGDVIELGIEGLGEQRQEVIPAP